MKHSVLPILVSLLILCPACVKNFNPDDLLSSGLPEDLPQENIEVTVGNVTFTMVYVKGGTFSMGATTEQYSDSYTDELPVHKVTLSDYYIGETEVTQGLWEAVMGENPGHEQNATYPVNNVSWYDCQTFVGKLRELTGYSFCLPSEAQWEYAARGGSLSQSYKYAGSDYIGSVAWYSENSSTISHQPAMKSPNELGVYDLTGNMGEWCYDWYCDTYRSVAQVNPIGLDTGTYRIQRGGAYNYEPATCRNSYRDGNLPDDRYINLGMRLCISAHTPVPDVADSDDTTTESNEVKVSDNLIHINGVEYKMLPVEGGTLTMNHPYMAVSTGSSQPASSQTVTLSDYRLGQTEVTQALWEVVMKYEGVSKDGSSTITSMQDIWPGDEPTKENGLGDEYPAYGVSYSDIVDIFLPRLNAITGRTYALPTEAQWEFAARGGNITRGYTYSGSDLVDYVAWYADNSGNMTHVVLSKEPNELGFMDMSGNVSEWCSDWYGYYTGTELTNPAGARTGTTRVYRGGSYSSKVSTGIVGAVPSEHELKPNTRLAALPDTRDLTRGFRIVEATAENNYPPTTFTVSGVSFNMVAVDGGTFLMGAQSSDSSADNYDSDAGSSESPVHSVTLSDYYIGETEVTQALWEAVMTYSGTTTTGETLTAYSDPWLGSNPSSSYGVGDNYPAYYVSYDDIVDIFLPRLNAITGKNFRLPTEAEWEYAARGGNKSKGYKYAGSNTISDVAWYYSSATHPVGGKQANELGLYDMSGNVSEWCSDRYGSYSSSPMTNPTGPATGSCYVSRAGGWAAAARACRVSFRLETSPDYRSSSDGFRLALTK
ncbi:MAG: SUMF1/EgtB/PvdO family nonheme iron enzyme [Coprobacter sp.]|nr:SUMF1/EgtB/PvdO family nonheme iron enzyme [Coprobacter sp.]